jgi:hypothetical protein
MSHTPGHCLTQAAATLEAAQARVSNMLAQSYSGGNLDRCQQVTQIAAAQAAAWSALAIASATVDVSRLSAARVPFPGAPQAATEDSPASADDVPSPS